MTALAQIVIQAQDNASATLGHVAQKVDELDDSNSRVTSGVAALKTGFGGLVNVLGAVAAALGITELVRLADAMTLSDARLKMVTGSAKDFAEAQASIYAVAQKNNIGLAEAAQLYTKLHEPVQRMGGTTRETEAIVKSFSASLRVGGASAQEASSATLQFAQAMASGKLQGDEFRAMAEASPRFMKALAEGMNVPVEKLKAMGTEGKLTADVVGNALMKSLGALERELKQMPDTVGGAMTRVKNDFLVAVNTLNQSTGATAWLASGIEAARLMIPDLQSALVGAWRAGSEWVERNREGIVGVYEGVVALGGQVWEVVKAGARIVAWVADFLLRSEDVNTIWRVLLAVFKNASVAVSLLIAGFRDGIEILGAGFSVVGSRILALVGIFSDSARTASREAAAAADVVFARFRNGETAVGALNAQLAASQKSASGAKTTLNGAGGAAAEMAREMQVLSGRAANTTTGLRTLKSVTDDGSDAKKKAAGAVKELADKYDGLLKKIEERNAALDAEIANGAKLTESEKLLVQVKEWAAQAYNKTTLRAIEHRLAIAEEGVQKEKLIAQNKAVQKSIEDMAKEQAKQIETEQKQLDSLQQQITKQLESNAAIGLSKEALEALELAKLDDAAASLRQKIAGADNLQHQEAMIDVWQRQIDALGVLKSARASGNATREMIEQADAARKAWEDAARGIENALVGAFDGWITQGQSLAKNLAQIIKNTFNGMVLRPVIQAVMQPLASGITNLLGSLGGLANTGAGSGILGLLSGGAGMFGNGVLSGLGMLLQGGGAMGLAGLGTALGMGSSAIAGGSIMGGLGTFAGALGPFALALGALSSISKKYSGETRSGGLYSTGLGYANTPGLTLASTTYLSGPSGGEIAGAEVRALMDATFSGINNRLQALGSTVRALGLVGGLESSDRGRGGVLAGANLSTGMRVGESGYGSNYNGTLYEGFTAASLTGEQALQAFGEDMAQLQIQVLQATTDLPQRVRAMVQGINAEALKLEDATALLGRIDAMTEGVRGFFSAVNALPLTNLRNLSFDAAAGLLELTGGLDAFVAKTGRYIEKYYSEAERAAIAAQAIQSQLSAAGITADLRTTQDLRALFESTSATTEQLAAILNVADQYAGLTEYLGRTNQTLGDLAGQAPQTQALQAMQANTAAANDFAKRQAEAAERTEAAAREFVKKLGELTEEMQAVNPAMVSAMRRAADGIETLVQDGIETREAL